MRITLRGLGQNEADGRTLDGDPLATFETLLNVRDYPASDPVLAWQGVDDLAALDVDMMPGHRVDWDCVARIKGCHDEPAFFWVTHGGGLRCIFTAGPAPASLTAAERCAMFAYLFVHREAIAYTRIEIKSDTRHPAYPRVRGGVTQRCGRVHRGSACDVARAVAMIEGDDESVTDEQVAEWLASQGFERGKRYDHDRCPIAPSSRGQGNPVVVLDRGVYCHYCKGNGPRGFIPWVHCIDPEKRHRRPNTVKMCVRGPAHWEHAKCVIESATGETGPHVELLYRAMVKTYHLKADESDAQQAATLGRINSVFYPPTPIVRGRGCWFHPDMATTLNPAGLSGILATLPAVKYVDEKGDVKTSSRKLGFLQNNGDVSAFGYPLLLPIRGIDFGWREMIDITQQRSPAESWPTARSVVKADPPFVERPASDLAWAERHIERHFPGVRLDVLRLLIAGKGVSQLDPSEPPLLMIHGQSESAKSAHVLLAAELCCDRVTKAQIGRDENEFLMHVAAGADAGSFVFIDEVAKQKAIDKILSARLLLIARGQQYRALYIGSRVLPPLPVVAMADTVVPGVLRKDVQLARRVVEVDLGCGISATGADWRVTCGTGDIKGWRAASDENTRAADAFTFDVIRNYVDSDFKAIAKRLGFATFRDAVSDLDTTADHRAFFEAVCLAPDATTTLVRGRGYKLLDFDRETPMAVAFHSLGLQGVTGAKWGDILGVPGVELDFQQPRKQAFVRFRLGKSGAASTKINAEIVEGRPVAALAAPVAAPVAARDESTEPVGVITFESMSWLSKLGCCAFSS